MLSRLGSRSVARLGAPARSLATTVKKSKKNDFKISGI